MANPYTVYQRELKAGEPTADIIRELWSFYQFMMSDEEIVKQFDQWKTYELLKKD